MSSHAQVPCPTSQTCLELMKENPLIPRGDPMMGKLLEDEDEQWYRSKVSSEKESSLRQKYQGQKIDVLESADYDHFVLHYLSRNRPVLIKHCTDGWRVYEDWIDSKGMLNVANLKKDCVDCEVCVTVQSRGRKKEDKIERKKLYEYLDWWKDRSENEVELRYLKDWHCCHFLQTKPFYRTPVYFQDDWLSPYYQARGDSEETKDYYFVYLGPASTWTPLHSDVLRSYSWSVNIFGQKRWKLLPPELTYLLYSKTGHTLAADFDLEDTSEFLNLQLASDLAIEVNQSAGDCLFVPSGWHHVVHNLTDVLSINHNWINAFNIHWSWQLLQHTYLQARSLIDDCKALCPPSEFETLIQKMVKSDSGMGFLEYVRFLQFSLERTELLTGRHLMKKFQSGRINVVLQQIHEFKNVQDQLNEEDVQASLWVKQLDEEIRQCRSFPCL